MELNEEQIERYSRHLLLPEVGGKGQEKISNARVVILGAGGLGSPAAYYLAAAGVGTIGIIDSDRVERSNLQRQILHFTEDVNKAKVSSAREKLQALNPGVTVKTYPVRLNASNIRETIGGYDVILDGSDNFPARFLLNDACFFEKKPLVSGAILRFDGQVSVFDLRNGGPCYRCLFPEPPPPDLVPSCQEAGVLGAVAGITGAIQAMEALKIILGVGKPLIGHLLCFDGLTATFERFKIRKNPQCPLCGVAPRIERLSEHLLGCEFNFNGGRRP
ncbi:MAG: ThiF family adenylyltransferase [Thermodesulfobacteriota bacterium]